jgi:parallel beta-helix repeat protein
MKQTTIIVAVGLALAGAPTAPANAQNARSFVSGQGSDSNNCTLAAPCRTFQAAFNMTNAGGEILTLNPAGYGPVTINKSVSIVSSLGVGGVNMLAAGDAITINAGPNDIVSLRGLNIDGLGIAATGIVFNSGLRLEIIDSVVRNFTLTGIFIQPTNAGMTLLISNTRVLDNPNSAGIDITPRTGGQIATATIDGVTVENNNYGIYMDASATNTLVHATITNSVVSSNLNTGLAVVRASGSQGAQANVKDTTLSANPTGISVSGSGGGVLYLSHSMIVSSTTGINTGSPSTVYSAGNNDISQNVTPVIGTLTAAPQQ